MDINCQINNGALVCPKTRQQLIPGNDKLQTPDGVYQYSFINGIPIFINVEHFGGVATPMATEYSQYNKLSWLQKLLQPLRTWLSTDFRSQQSMEVFNKMLAELPNDALLISVGGGPTKINNNFTNININAFANVDVVADAHELPYQDNVVDLIHCEAVLEHLAHPQKAVMEMFRVLRPGGKVYVVTPFLQPYHGYPYHFQNFTLQGHQQLFTDAGFTILDSGTCVGAAYMLTQMNLLFIKKFLPKPLRWLIWPPLAILARLFFRPLDRWLNQNPTTHEIASTTFVAAVKFKD